jgi:hypothetical protein
MLHCFLREKNTPLSERHASAINIDTALREWFNHGESVYETRRQQMKEVARRSGVAYMCTLLDTTYDDLVQVWKDKYAQASVMPLKEPPR